MSHKIVINTCYGGFGLSDEAIKWLESRGVDDTYELSRHDPLLVECVETLGEKANSPYSRLAVIEIEGNLYRVEEYDGKEWIEQPEKMEWIKIEEGIK